MNYNQYLKEKIINLYLIKQKIGKTNNNNFDFLNIYFDNKNEIKPNIYSVSEVLQYIIKDYDSNLKLKNKIGIDFLNSLINSRKTSQNFLESDTLKTPQITNEQKEELELKYTEIANKYGLKEFYYTLNPNLTPEENYNKAILLLNRTQLDIELIQQKLNIKESYKIGSNILSIQLNWQEYPSSQGYYNHCSNTICLKDENSSFSLTHEYIHFIDKTTTCLLFTGKTSQQLYEEKLFSQTELLDNFDMSIFSRLEFNKKKFPWINTIKLNFLFNEEIKQNKYIHNIFNKYEKNKDYKKEFQETLFNWIDEQQYFNKDKLKKDIKIILQQKTNNFKPQYELYSNDEKTMLNIALLFNTFNLRANNSISWTTELDSKINNNEPYYLTSKEMLARTIEQSIKGQSDQLTDRLTTPTLSKNEQDKFFKIIKSWKNISEEIVKTHDNQEVSNRVMNIRNTLDKKPDLISCLKLKS